MKSINVLNVGQNYYVEGGSDKYLIDLERLLEDNGNNVIIFVSKNKKNNPSKWEKYFPAPADFLKPSFVDIVNFLYSIQARKSIEKLLNNQKINIAHLHIYYGKLTSSILGELFKRKIPVVQTLHEYKLVCPVYTLTRRGENCDKCKNFRYWNCFVNRCNRNSFLRSLLSTVEAYISKANGAIRGVDRFITVSDFQKNKYIEMGFPPEKLITIHNFVYPPKSLEKPALGDYLLYFGRIEKIKGIATIIDASKRAGKLPLKIVGTGNDFEELVLYAKESMSTNVEFCGYKSGVELEEIILGARIVLVPSEWYETFGLTTVEAMLRSKPVIASNIGGIPEVVDDGKTGLLVEPANIDAWSKAISELWGNSPRLLEMGKSGREKALKEFSPEAHFEKICKVYSEVLGFQNGFT